MIQTSYIFINEKFMDVHNEHYFSLWMLIISVYGCSCDICNFYIFSYGEFIDKCIHYFNLWILINLVYGCSLNFEFYGFVNYFSRLNFFSIYYHFY